MASKIDRKLERDYNYFDCIHSFFALLRGMEVNENV